MDWEFAQDISFELEKIVKASSLTHIDYKRLICFRSQGSKSRATARIWSLPRIWQMALKIPPYYCIEVISEKYDKLRPEEKQKTLIHELMHIPRNFSGSLLPHRTRHRRIDRRAIEKIFKIFQSSSL